MEVAPPHKSLQLLTLFTLHVEYTLLKLQQFWPYMRFLENRQPRRIKHHDVVQCSQRGSRPSCFKDTMPQCTMGLDLEIGKLMLVLCFLIFDQKTILFPRDLFLPAEPARYLVG